MAEYKSSYTGLEIDTALGLANTAIQSSDLSTVATSGSYNDLSNKPTIPTNSDFTLNGLSEKSYNNLTDKPTIPDVSNFITKDVNDLTYYELKTATGNNIVMSIDSSTYVLTVSLRNSANTVLNTQTVDLPLETMVVSGSYDSTNKKIILTLKNGQTIEFSVADLVSGLQSEITSSNKLSADLVDDTSTTNKFVSTSDKTTWNAKYDKPSGGIPNTDLSSAVQTSLGKANTAIQSSDLSSVATSGDYDDLLNKPTIPTVPTNISAFTNDTGYTTNTGTITSVKMNGSTIASSGEADLGTVITQHQDISGKLDTSKVKTTYSTTSGDVYASTYINSLIGDINTILATLTTPSSNS